MGTVFRNPHWLVPDNANKTKKANYSLDFDGASSYVDVGPFNLGIDASISMWFNPASIGPTDYVLLGEDTTGFDYFIRRSSGSFFVWIGSTFYNFGSTITNNIINDAWNFLAITKDRGQVTVHLRNSNGNFSVSQTESAWQTAVMRFDRIGARTASPADYPFEGKICQVSAYSYILSNDDISTLYGNATDGVGDPLSLDTLPVAYFPLGNELIYNNSGFICPNMVNSEKGSGNFLSTDFDGVNDFITTSNSSDYKEVEDNWTLSYWMKTPDAGSNQRNLTSGSGFFQYSNTYYNNGLYFYQTFPGNAWVKVTDSLEDDQWHNIVIRCQGGNTHECYVDGVQTYSNSGGQFPSSGTITTIGAYDTGSVRHFNGRISQVALFSNSSPDLPSELYNGGIQPDVTTFSDLEMLWEGGKNSKIANGGMVYTDAVNETSVYVANNFSFEALVSDTPNSSSGSGISQGTPITALVNTAPYTINNVISRNSSGFSQLLPFGADQSNVADPTKLNITLQTGLYNGDLIGRFKADRVVAGAMIDWGDGNVPVPLNSGNNDHTYPDPGLYNVKVSGTFAPNFNNDVYARNYVNLAHWGDNVVYNDMYVGFRGAWNLDITAYDSPTLVADLPDGIRWGYCFQNCKRLTNANGSIANLDMSNTNDAGGTSNVGLVSLFQDAPRFNVDISRWNLPSTGLSMVNMFNGAITFNQPVGLWNITPTNSQSAFAYTHKFNQPLTNWTLPTSVNFMFRNARSFDSYPGAFNSATTNVQYMFAGANGNNPSVFNQDISGWDVSNVTNFSNMLANATTFNQPIGNWTINTTPGDTVSMNGMLYNTDGFNQNISSWDVRNVTSMNNFQSYKGTGISATGTNTESLVSMSQGFRRNNSNDSWIANIDTSQLSNIFYAFEGNADIDQDLGDWDISKLITATFAFGNTPSFSTSNVTSTLTKWAIKNYLNNARKDVSVGTANVFSGRTFDNAQTSDTAGTPFPFPTNFTMSLVGSPDVGGSGDHCKVVNVSGDNQLEARDMACGASDNVTFETLVLGGGNGANSNVSVTIPYYWNATSGVSATTGIVADYKIDGGSWTNFINDTVKATSGTSGSNASPTIGTVSGLSFTTSFQVRFTLQCGDSSNSICNVKEVVINKGTTNIFTEDFSNQLGAGWDNNTYTAANPAFANAGEALDYFIDPNGGNWINVANNVTRIN